MQRPPSLARVLEFPVSGGVCLLAVTVSCVAWYGHVDPSPLKLNYQTWHGQPWRLLTSTLFHVNPLHLLFDVYWTFVFGAIVEKAFGSIFTLGLILLLAAGSMAAEYAFLVGGVGLSGVGYGLFGFLWVLGRYNRRFEGVIDKNTAWMFVGWFFLCIFLTVANLQPVANIAHGVGALLGGIAGYAMTRRGRQRMEVAAALTAVVALALFCSTPRARTFLNVSRSAGDDEFQLGYKALQDHQDQDAINYLRKAVAYRRVDPAYWYDLGIAYTRLGQRPLAADAFRHALAMVPDSKDFQDALDSVQSP